MQFEILDSEIRHQTVQTGQKFLIKLCKLIIWSPAYDTVPLFQLSLFPQAQVDDFEKRLTAVHTRGLENVESPEMDEENQQRQGEPSRKPPTAAQLATRGRQKSRRGERVHRSSSAAVGAPALKLFSSTSSFTGAGQSKASSSGADDSFVTPRKTRKSKKPMVTFSSDEEEDEEGEWSDLAFSLSSLLCCCLHL